MKCRDKAVCDESLNGLVLFSRAWRDPFGSSEPNSTHEDAFIMVATVLGEAGKHARAAVGMASLPFNAAVEIDAVIEIA